MARVNGRRNAVRETDGEQPTYTLTVKDLPEAERPRERLLQHGAGALATSELIAIVLRTGTTDEMVTLLSQRLLVEFGGLSGLARAPIAELSRRKGLGGAKVAELKAALELGRRLTLEAPEERAQVRSPADVAALLQVEMGLLEQEQLRVVLLDTKNRVIRIETVYQGSLNSSAVRVGELFKAAIRHNAACVVIVHNHPSGDPSPSGDDVRVTEAIVEAGRLLDVDVLDHVIVGAHRWVSLKERGLGFR